MKNNKILLYIMALLSLCMIVYAVEGEIIYRATPIEDISRDDIDRTYHSYKQYEGHNMPLPPYVPHSTWSKLKRINVSYGDTQVIGRHIMRFFDGNKYTNLREEGFEPDNLTEFEKSQMERMALETHVENNSAGECEMTAFLRTSDQFGSNSISYDDDTYEIAWEIYYAYDLGYFYVPTIRNLLAPNIRNILAGTEWSVRDFISKKIENEYFLSQGWSNYEEFLDLAITLRAGEDFTFYDGTATAEFIVYDPYGIYGDMYDDADIITEPSLERPCVAWIPEDGFYESYYCFTEQEHEDALLLLDIWLINLLNGNYQPPDCVDTLNTYANVNKVYADCLELTQQHSYTLLTLLEGALVYDFTYGIVDMFTEESLSDLTRRLQMCQDYISDAKREFCDVVIDTDAVSIADVIWDYYRTDLEIRKGSNLYPFNIEAGRIKCSDESDDWDGSINYLTGAVKGFGVTENIGENSLYPNRILPTVFCDYSRYNYSSHNITIQYKIKHNPLFGLVAGAYTVDQAYSVDHLRDFFGDRLTTISIDDRDSAVWFETKVTMNESDGCLVYLTTDQANNTLNEVDDKLINPANNNANKFGEEIWKTLELELKLRKSENYQIEFLSVLVFIAQVMHRIFILIYYILSMVLFSGFLMLVMSIPYNILIGLRDLYKKKIKRRLL